MSADQVYHYAVYGLRLSSHHPLPAPFSIDEVASDLDLHLDGAWPAAVPPLSAADWLATSFVEAPADTAVIVRSLLTAVGRFTHVQFNLQPGQVELLIDPTASNVWLLWSGTITFDDVVAVLLGPGLGCVLRLRGVIGLHGSVAAKGGRAMAVLGPSGRGKSTTAAALLQYDFSVLSDDIAVLFETSSGFWVQPGYARLRVAPAAALALEQQPQTMALVHSFGDKRYLELESGAAGRRFGAHALPLSAIYVLDKRNPHQQAPMAAPFSPRASLAILVKHSYVRYVADRELRAREFASFSRLAEQVPIRRLACSDALSDLPQLAALLAADFEAQAQP